MTEAIANPFVHIVDDDVNVVESLLLLLTFLKRPARAWHSATDFLEKAELGSQDILLLDLHMPDMDGFMLLTALHARAQHPPAVLMTGHANADVVRTATRLGIKKILDKPFSEDELAAALDLAAAQER